MTEDIVPLRFDLPDSLPLFSVPEAILLPRGNLPLQIFEARYLQMFEDVLKTDHRMIGMIQPLPDDGFCEVGGAGRIAGFAETDDGRIMLTLKAVSRFRVKEIEDGFLPYSKARVDWSGFEQDRLQRSQSAPELDRDHLFEKLRRFMKIQELSTDWKTIEGAGDEMLVNSLAMLLPFEPSEKQALLEAQTLSERSALLLSLIDFALHGNGEREGQLQ